MKTVQPTGNAADDLATARVARAADARTERLAILPLVRRVASTSVAEVAAASADHVVPHTLPVSNSPSVHAILR